LLSKIENLDERAGNSGKGHLHEKNKIGMKVVFPHVLQNGRYEKWKSKISQVYRFREFGPEVVNKKSVRHRSGYEHRVGASVSAPAVGREKRSVQKSRAPSLPTADGGEPADILTARVESNCASRYAQR
jgi:hypothetical protein